VVNHVKFFEVLIQKSGLTMEVAPFSWIFMGLHYLIKTVCGEVPALQYAQCLLQVPGQIKKCFEGFGKIEDFKMAFLL
jgi:hypothetical protein